MTASPYTISVDTGGTFTDLVLADEERILGLFKASTTPGDLFMGISNALELAAASRGTTARELLARTSAFVYSTTRSTNAIIEGEVATTAFLTTRGNRDILLYREGGKDQPHNLAIPYPEPYVPRRLTFELSERILSDGSVAVALDEAEVRRIIARLRELEVEAVGVCLLWSVVNPSHEERVGELLDAELPDVAYSLSHRVNPIVREYRRASATVIDASIKPLMREHLEGLDGRLRALGFAGEPLMVTHVSGGVQQLEQMSARPLQTIDSGPSLAPVAGRVYARAEDGGAGLGDVVVVDTGGTSFDVSLVHGDDILYTREKWLGPKWYGHMTGLPAVDTQSIGAGGGSIAKVDAGGLLRVGPASAGADPGPACYGRGGRKATVTDAALVLGYLDPHNFLGGRMTLDPAAALDVVTADVAKPLGLTAPEAAEAILRVASESMRGFITDMTVAQGRDPRRCVLVAGGGAAGLNIARIARDLGIDRIIVPKLAGGLSATGGQFSDITATFSTSAYTTSAAFDFAAVNAALADLDGRMTAFFAEVGATGERRRRFACEARYDQQIWEIDVDLGAQARFDGDGDVARLQERFDRAHLELFAVNQPGTPIEVVTWRGEARIVRGKPALSVEHGEPDPVARPSATRIARFGGRDHVTDVYRAGDAPPGSRLEGPAVIEEPTTTIVVPPDSVAVVRATHYVIVLADTVQESWVAASASEATSR